MGKEDLNSGELRSVEEKLTRFSCRRILFVPKKEKLPKEPNGIEVWDVDAILNREQEN
ncbi:MAG: hypothetical protein HA496_06855 [Thaumarchaeota archaeon]|nr:hypothetical protein [Nitrososphaerota archaeon]